MKKVLVTGANGFIGKTLVRALLERDYSIVALDIRFDEELEDNDVLSYYTSFSEGSVAA